MYAIETYSKTEWNKGVRILIGRHFNDRVGLANNTYMKMD